MFAHFQWSVFAPVAGYIAFVVLAILFALIEWELRKLAANKALTAQQQVWAATALRLVTAAEQDYAAVAGPQGAAKFSQVDAGLATLLPKGVTPAQRKALIQGAVYALHAGVVALAPNAAAVLPPLQGAGLTTAPFDVTAFQADVKAMATAVAKGEAQAGIRDAVIGALGLGTTITAGATAPPPPQAPLPQAVTVNVVPAAPAGPTPANEVEPHTA